MDQSAGETTNTPATNPKPFPDESNREDIQRMLLHAFEFCVKDGFLRVEDGHLIIDGQKVEDLPAVGSVLPMVSRHMDTGAITMAGLTSPITSNDDCPIHGVPDECASTRDDIFRCPICQLLAVDVEETDGQGRKICQACAAKREAGDGWYDPRS